MNKSNEEILLDQDALDLLKAKIGGGEQVSYYRHIVDCEANDPQLCFPGTFRLDIITTAATAFNYQSLKQYLIDNDYVNTTGYPCLTCEEGTLKLSECSSIGEEDKIATETLFLTTEYNTVKDTVIPFTPEANA